MTSSHSHRLGMWQTSTDSQDDVSVYSVLCPVLDFGGAMANLPFRLQDDLLMS